MDSATSRAVDPASHLEVTSILVAACRAVEARKPSPLVVDAFAERFVTAAGGRWTEIFREAGPIRDLLGAGEFGHNFVNYQAARTTLFDRFVTDALHAGIDQVAILAAGLDSRGLRLDWPHQAVLYELDRPGVLQFKSTVLEALDADVAVKRITVGADLERDWPTALCAAGFDPGRPTAWLVEGLLMYLSSDAEFDLLTKLVSLSAPGSRVAIEHTDVADAIPENPAGSPQHAQMRDLIRNETRRDPIPWFADRGWHTQAVGSADLLADVGRPLTLNIRTPLHTAVFVRAELPPE